MQNKPTYITKYKYYLNIIKIIVTTITTTMKTMLYQYFSIQYNCQYFKTIKYNKPVNIHWSLFNNGTMTYI